MVDVSSEPAELSGRGAEGARRGQLEGGPWRLSSLLLDSRSQSGGGESGGTGMRTMYGLYTPLNIDMTTGSNLHILCCHGAGGHDYYSIWV